MLQQWLTVEMACASTVHCVASKQSSAEWAYLSIYWYLCGQPGAVQSMAIYINCWYGFLMPFLCSEPLYQGGEKIP